MEQIKTTRQFNQERHLRDVLNKANDVESGIIGHTDEVYITKPYQKIDPLGYIIGTIPTDGYFDIPPKKNRYVYSISAKDKDFIETANIPSAIVRNWVLCHRKPRSVKMLQAI